MNDGRVSDNLPRISCGYSTFLFLSRLVGRKVIAAVRCFPRSLGVSISNERRGARARLVKVRYYRLFNSRVFFYLSR